VPVPPVVLPTSGTTTPKYEIGVLLADEQRIDTDKKAGVRLAVFELRWDKWQPSSGTGGVGVTDAAYRAAMMTKADHYRAAGYKVALDLGLQHAPAWVLNMPNGQLRAQTGQLSGSANYVFNAAVRDAAAGYMSDVIASMGSIAYARIGLSQAGETLYPEAPTGQWWGFDDLAQGRAAGRPASIPAPPMPGWVPGTATWNGQPVSQAQVQAWYDWYLGASVDAHAWQIASLRRAGYNGELQLVMPGNGANYWVYTHRLSSLLAEQSYDGFHTMNTAAVWPEFLSRLPDRRGLVVDVSSVADGGGGTTNAACTPADSTVDYRTDRSVDNWSSVRWLSYLAAKNGLPITGENPGNSSAATMSTAFSLMASCQLRGLMWAWDFQLYDGVHASVSDLAREVSLRS
jgi:hypothetical protein